MRTSIVGVAGLLVGLIACGEAPPPPEAAPPAAAETPKEAPRLNVAKSTASFASGPRKVPLEVLLTGDPTLFGTYVDAGEVWIDVGLSGMVIDVGTGKVVTKADSAQNVRSIALRGFDKVAVLEEKVDPNSEGNKLLKVHAVGKYAGCEAGGAGATLCHVDLGDPPPGSEGVASSAEIRPGHTTVPAPPAPAAAPPGDAAATTPK